MKSGMFDTVRLLTYIRIRGTVTNTVNRIKKYPYSLSISLVTLTAIFFWPMMTKFFAIDDFSWLHYSGQNLNDFGQWIYAFMHINGSGQYRPLSQQLFFWIGYHLFGVDPLGFHLINTITFLAACWYLIKFLGFFTKSKLIQCSAAILFCLSPVHVEHLFWVSAYTETLATLCVAAALYYAARGSKVLTVFWYCLGLLSNESTIIIPLMIFALHSIYLKDSLRVSLIKTRGLWIVLVIYTLLRLTLFGGLGAKGVFSAVFSPFVWLKEIQHSIQISVGYGPVMDFVTGSSEIFRFIVTVLSLGVIALIVWGFFLARKSPNRKNIVVLGCVIFIIGLLPTLPFAHNFADYTVSIPIVGLPLILIGLLGEVNRSSYINLSIAVALFLLFAVHIYSPRGLYHIDGYRTLSTADYSAYVELQAAYFKIQRPLNVVLTGSNVEKVSPGIDEMAKLFDSRSKVVPHNSMVKNIVLRYDGQTGVFDSSLE